LPPEIGQLENLESLYLDNAQLESLSQTIINLDKLNSLSLKRTPIGEKLEEKGLKNYVMFNKEDAQKLLKAALDLQ
tara:strand:+ start:511 stop:738 length:228 start_codon:yes stop_codon:yes gene_type:complete